MAPDDIGIRRPGRKATDGVGKGPCASIPQRVPPPPTLRPGSYTHPTPCAALPPGGKPLRHLGCCCGLRWDDMPLPVRWGPGWCLDARYKTSMAGGEDNVSSWYDGSRRSSSSSSGTGGGTGGREQGDGRAGAQRGGAAGAMGAGLPGAQNANQTSPAPVARALVFSATARGMPLVNGAGKRQAGIAYYAYPMAPEAGRERPVTFAVNGGPGAASAYLNLGAIGPWRLPVGGDSISPVSYAVKYHTSCLFVVRYGF